ncbi:MAG: hypothetical protein SGI88_10710 [Candidatus Hydrogenedentes bacterium]|nr:hypothetical protein [Candidatus Hydrogenedentota bacterium]
MRFIPISVLVLAVTVASGCSPAPAPVQDSTPTPETTSIVSEPVATSTDTESPAHAHTAPHGGTLVMLGDHVANVELVLNPTIGALTAFILDGEAENAVPLSAPGLPVVITLEGQEPQTLTLAPAENVLTGETKESTSQFTAQFDALKGATAFKGSIPELTIYGVTMKNIAFEFP